MLLILLAGVGGACLDTPLNFNGGFELGTEGYALTRNLEPDINPQLEYLPLELDRQAPGSGRQSALIRNGRGEFFVLHSKEFQLKNDVEYEVSFKAKSSVSDSWLRIIVFCVNSDGKYYDDGTGKMLSPKWTEYKYTMKAKLPGWYHFKLSSQKACDIWLDDLSIVEKSPAVTAKPLETFMEAAVVPGSYLYDKEEDSVAKFKLKVVNIGDAPAAKTLKLVGRDEYFGDVLFSLECPVSLAAGEMKEFPFEQPLTRYGSVRVEIAGAGNSHSGFYSVIGHYDSKPVDISKTFCVGLNSGSSKWLPPRIARPAYIVKNGSLESCFAIYERIGCRIIREWGNGVGSTQWYQMEPKQGEWNYSYLDKQLELYRKFHIEALPVIGNDDFIARTKNYQQLFLPEWLITLCARIKKDPPNVTEERVRGNVLLPPENLWRAYVRNCMLHANGRFQAVEIMNEPNLFLAPEVYNRYLKAASEEIRAAGSKTTIVGFCLSSDFGASALDWGKMCFKDGGLNYVDAVGFHPYGSRQLNSPFPADKDIAGLRALLKPYGNYPFWNTELFYVTDNPSPNYVVKSECRPYHVAWRFLTDLGEGARQSICLQSDQIWKPLLTPNCVSMERVTEWAPSEIAVAYNALARIFEDATPVDSVRWGNDSICYVYEREGKPLAAFWNHGKMKNLKLRLDASKTSGLKLLDIFGNEVKFSQDGVLTLSENPFYLVAREKSVFNISSKMSVKDFLAFLKNGRVEADRPVEACPIGRLVPKNGGWTVVVAFRNCAGRGLVGKLSLQGDGLNTVASVAFSILSGEELSLPVPVKLDAAKLGGKVAAKFEIEGQAWEFPLTMGRPGMVLRPGGQAFFGPASMKLESDGKTLKLFFAVKDSTPDAYVAGGAPWMQDCVELSFDASPLQNSVKYPERYTGDVARLFILPAAPEGARLVMQPRGLKLDGAKTVCAKKDGGYSVELEIPRTAFTGKTIGFEAQIDDGDAVDRKAQASWNSQGDAYKNRLSFGFIELE